MALTVTSSGHNAMKHKSEDWQNFFQKDMMLPLIWYSASRLIWLIASCTLQSS